MPGEGLGRCLRCRRIVAIVDGHFELHTCIPATAPAFCGKCSARLGDIRLAHAGADLARIFDAHSCDRALAEQHLRAGTLLVGRERVRA